MSTPSADGYLNEYIPLQYKPFQYGHSVFDSVRLIFRNEAWELKDDGGLFAHRAASLTRFQRLWVRVTVDALCQRDESGLH